MKRLTGLLVLAGLGCAGVGSADPESTTASPATEARPEAQPTAERSAEPAATTAAPGPPGGRPGDGQGPGARAGRPSAAEVEPTTRVANPVSGAELAVYVDTPEGDGPFNAIVMVPGSTRDGATLLPPKAIQQFVDHGYAVVRYDPDGRGNSTGTEDLGGKAHQAALKSVIHYASDRPDIADAKVGVISYSFGIATAAGALADGDSGAVWLIDWEGPVDRDSIAGCDTDVGKAKPFHDHGCDDESFWAEREAVRSLSRLTVPYQRFQSSRDHVHGADHGHATRALEAVADSDAWFRLNDGDIKATSAEMLTTGRGDRDQWLIDYADDLFAVVEGQSVETREHVASGDPPVRKGGKAKAGRPRGGGRPGQ